MCNLIQRVGGGTVAECELRTRAATLLDTEAIATIHNQYVGSGPYTMEEDPWSPLDVKVALNQFSARERFIVCENETPRVLGWSVVRAYSQRSGYRIACELSVYVDRESRGKQVGRQLLQASLAQAKQFGYHHAVAKIITGNQASLDFHLQNGFELVGIQREIGLVDGHYADVAILQCLLANVSV